MNKILILSCNTGEGHNSCGKALREAFEARGIPCIMEDTLRFISSSVSRMVSFVFVRMYRHFPGVFRYGYQYSEDHPGLFKDRSGVYKMLTAGAERLHRFITREGYDTVICTHVFSALVVSNILRRHDTPLRTFFVATDYTCSPSCGESCLDTYFIPHESLMDDFVRCGVPRERLVASGIPIRRAILRSYDKAEAKRKAGIRADQRHLLIMCGSMGCGPIRKLVKELSKTLPENVYISVVCGTNHHLKKTLDHIYAQEQRIGIYGFVGDISTMLDSSDLFLTKPGGISVTEAAQKRLPMAFVNAVAGCETYNMRFYLERGVAVTADTPKAVASKASELLSNGAMLESMRDNFGDWAENNAVEIIVQMTIAENIPHEELEELIPVNAVERGCDA